MRRYSWVSLSCRHLLSSTTLDLGNDFRRLTSLPGSIFIDRFFSYNVSKQPIIIGRSEMRLIKWRYIHATGTRYAKEPNFYQILGVSNNASGEEIRTSFHELAKKYHPDANKDNPSAKRKFQEIREAYETLRDPKKREEYDSVNKRGSEKVKYGAGNPRGFRYADDENAGFTYGFGNPGGFRYTYQTNFSNSFQKIFSEIFEDETSRFGSDIQLELQISFSEAARGCVKHMKFNAYVPCDSCDGLGYPIDATKRVCPTCGGVGKVAIPPFTSTCGTCKGSGFVIKDYCMSCGGSGVVEDTKEATVTIPAGMDTGDTIRVPGAGNYRGRGSQHGDLFIKLKVADDPVFTRDGADVHVDADISFTQAILGGKIDVPTLSGKIQVKIPKGVQPGQVVVLRGKGLPNYGFLVDHGDLHVQFRIKFPTEINERQREILQELAKEEMNNENIGSVEVNWWQKLLNQLTSPRFMLEFSVLTLILLLLNKIMT